MKKGDAPIFDSHCHLNFKAFADDAPAVANAMNAANVAGLVVGCDPASSRYGVDLAQTFDNLWASVGIHPIHVLDTPWDEPVMKELAEEDRVVAIGEVGLDFYRFPANATSDADRQTYLDAQYQTLRAAIRLAQQLDKPLVIHSRQAYDELIKVFKEYTNHSNLRGTVHCFMGTPAQAEQLLKLGFHLGFTGVITYKDVHPTLLQVVKQVPLDRLLIETDAPYLTPEPYRSQGKRATGKPTRNRPEYVVEVAKTVAAARGLDTKEIIEATENNARKLFNIDYQPKGVA